MAFPDQKLTSRSQWRSYQQLELIPEMISNPVDRANPFTSALNKLWRPLLNLLMDELVEEQRVEYLDRCWALDEFDEADPLSSKSLQRFWTLIN